MKHFKLFFMFAVLLMIGTTAYGQNVTISPKTGSLVGSLSEQNETGFAAGLSCLWRHEQLPLTFTSSDEDDMTSTGEIAKPKAALGKRYYTENSVKVDSAFIIAGGHRATYLTVSLPKGYRITGYKIVLVNDLNNYDLNPDKDLSGSGGSFNHVNQNSGTMRFYETTAWTTGTGGENSFNNLEPQGPEGYRIITQAMNGNDGNIDTNGSDWGKEYTIQRTSLDETDMGNQLYFRLTKNYYYYGITIKSFEIRFTAEGTFAADVAPEAVGLARSVVTSPFKTNKIDIGELRELTQEGTNVTMFCYDYNNVRDLTAYNYIYQENAVHNGSDIDEELKGRPTEGDETKTIYPVSVDGNVLYAFGNNTYYAETPIQVHTQSGLEAPVGFRIVGARFNYLWGTATPGGPQTLVDHYYITANRNGNPYYLNDNLEFTTTPYPWGYDNNTKNLYTSSGNTRYLACTGSGNSRTLSFSTENGNYYNLIVFTRNNTTYVGWDNETASQRYYLRYYRNGNSWRARVEQNQTSGAARVDMIDSHTIDLPGFTPGAYTLKVYDKNGEYEEGTDGKPTKGMKAVVSSASDAGGILELEDINNDAVKFEIEGLDEGKQALVSITLLIQALDPYIDNMNIVCHDPDNQLTLSKPFTANDFTVSGGKFIFYIPEEYQNTELTFTFSDLYSHYGDTTYPGGSNEHFGRYSFVTSDYFTPINGNGNDGLYESSYDPNAEATSKIFTSVAGNIRFKFNNAEDLSNTGSGEGYLEDYPFSVANYIGSADPDGTNKTGAFINCKLKASDVTQRSGIYYLFTADETRYNIAPTKAWQHRSYAFYRMDIELQAKTYTPDLVWEKIYDTDKTYYDNGKTKSQWGLKLRTTDEGEVVKGYLSVKQILDAIDNALTDDDTTAPAGKDQILYIDGSELYSIINSSIKEGESTTTLDLSDLKEDLGENAIVFLPENTTSTLDNYAYKTSSGSFMAGKNFVLTDKQPFYSPYEIQVDAASTVQYERMVTNAQNGKVTAASIILPFQISVDENGIHSNADGTQAFSLHQMQATDCLSDTAPADVAGGDNDVTYAFFPNVEAIKVSTPNKPYVVKVITPAPGDQTSFVVTQKGALIAASTEMDENDYTFTGESATGTSARGETATGSTTYNFTSKGTYSGVKIAKGEGVFYFAQNKFVNSNDLDAAHPVVKGQPFRAFYATSNSKSLLPGFEIYFGEGNGTPTGITDVTKRIDTGIKGGKGTITISSAIDNNVKIYNTSGMHFMNVDMQAGETKTVNIPAGIYVVNGVKIIVK